MPGGKALLVPVTNIDKVRGQRRAGRVRRARSSSTSAASSIRDIRKNAANQYLIVAGSWAADDNSDPYALYSWDGDPAHAPVKRVDLPTTDPGGWEAVVDVPDLTCPAPAPS